jgi:hypothetical protein
MSSEELLAQLEQNKVELEVVKKGQEETQAVIHELRLMMSALLSAPRNINTSPPSLPAAREDPDDTYDAREMPRHIEREPPPPSIPPLSTPLVASQRNVSMATSKRQEQRLPPIEKLQPPPGSARQNDQKSLQALQKGMQKPPNFEGNTGAKAEVITTWWRQMSNYAKTFAECDQAMLIKSYLRGSASDWLDSQERETGRELTLQELADGLAQEYGSEVTSEAALQALEGITMASPGCSTLQDYNKTFNQQYNLCSTKDQPIAVRCYIKGLHPKYLELVLQAGDRYSTLAEARAAATKAVAKYQQLQISKENFKAQTRAGSVPSVATSTVKFATAGDYGVKRWDSERYLGTKVNLNTFSVLADSDEPGADNDDNVTLCSTPDPSPAVAQAAVMSSSATSKPTGGPKKYQLTKEQVDMLRSENRCFKCYKPNHMKKDCRSKAATVAPLPLK